VLIFISIDWQPPVLPACKNPLTSPRVIMAPDTIFELRPGQPFSSEIKRILLEQADRAIWQLATPGLEVDPAVHDARKCFKRLRGVLRLVRDDIGESRFGELNALFRDAGRQLSDIRTSAVLAETLEKVHERYPHQLSDEDVANLVARLRAHHLALHQQVVPQKRLFHQVVDDLQRGRAMIEALPLQGNSFPAPGMRRVYARGRRGMQSARQQPTVAHFHEWRKRVKYLRYHVRLFSPAWLQVLGCVTDELVILSELLGLDHDLAELHLTLRENPDLCLHHRRHETVRNLIETYREELEARSLDIGLRLYAEKPGAFVNRMGAYWRAWQDNQG
jgi:CHAD domain-containing protein